MYDRAAARRGTGWYSRARFLRHTGSLGLLCVLLLGTARPSLAQSPDGFLLDRPSVRLGLFGGFASPGEGSQIFDFTREQFTVERGDFSSLVLAGAVGVRITERIDLAAEIGFARAEVHSEDREFLDTRGTPDEGDDTPIRQGTRFTRVPITLVLRGFLWDRGRSVGRFAWVPRAWSPYIGVGGGWVWYEFAQSGSFVDRGAPAPGDEFIFSGSPSSDGFTPVLHLLAGTEISLSPRWLMTVEGRYSWASERLDPLVFEGFTEGIDLSGFQATLGVSVRL